MGRSFFLKDTIFYETSSIALDKFLQLTFKIHHMRKSTGIYFRKDHSIEEFDYFINSLIQIQGTNESFKHVCKQGWAFSSASHFFPFAKQNMLAKFKIISKGYQ